MPVEMSSSLDRKVAVLLLLLGVTISLSKLRIWAHKNDIDLSLTNRIVHTIRELTNKYCCFYSFVLLCYCSRISLGIQGRTNCHFSRIHSQIVPIHFPGNIVCLNSWNMFKERPLYKMFLIQRLARMSRYKTFTSSIVQIVGICVTCTCWFFPPVNMTINPASVTV